MGQAGRDQLYSRQDGRPDYLYERHKHSRKGTCEPHFDADELHQRLRQIQIDQRLHEERGRSHIGAARSGAAPPGQSGHVAMMAMPYYEDGGLIRGGPVLFPNAQTWPAGDRASSHDHRPPRTKSNPRSARSFDTSSTTTSTEQMGEVRRAKRGSSSIVNSTSDLAGKALGTGTGGGRGLGGQSSSTMSCESCPTAAEYHHVPTEAARQFTRTTTIESMTGPSKVGGSGRGSRHRATGVHQLSQQALKFHKNGDQCGRAAAHDADLAPYEQARMLYHSQQQRERTLDRNQFQHAPLLNELAERERAALALNRRSSQHTWQAKLSQFKEPHTRPIVLPDERETLLQQLQLQQKYPHPSTGFIFAPVTRNAKGGTGRSAALPLTTVGAFDHVAENAKLRSSTLMPRGAGDDDVFVNITEGSTSPESEPARVDARRHRGHRVDWAHADAKAAAAAAAAAGGRPPTKRRFSPLLRKADSLFNLRGWRGNAGAKGGGAEERPSTSRSVQDGNEADEECQKQEQEQQRRPTLKTSRSGFFARFRN